MMMRSLWIATVVIAALAPAVNAQTAPASTTRRQQPTQTALDQARAHFKAAEAAKARGEYKTAAVEYLAAYELFQEPEFFFNVAEVHRLAGNEDDALTYYERYLELDPDGRGVASAREHADQLRRSIAARADLAARAQAEEERRRAEDARRNEEAARLAAARPLVRRGRNLRIAGIAAGGAGALALGVGVVFGLQARRIDRELSSAEMFDQDRYDAGRSAERNMFVFTGIGAAAIVAGGVLYYFGRRAPHVATSARAATVTFEPVVGSLQIGFAAKGRF